MPRGPICFYNGKQIDPADLERVHAAAVPDDLEELSKAELSKVAEGLGIDVKKSWTADRLREEIELAQEDDDEDDDEG